MARKRERMIVLAGVALCVAGLASGCTTEPLDEVEPHEHQFEFDGDTLDVRTDGIPTDLTTGDRDDVLVSYRVSTVTGEPDEPDLSLSDGRLDLGDPCPAMVLCDVRYLVEVPAGVTVLRDGEATEIDGAE